MVVVSTSNFALLQKPYFNILQTLNIRHGEIALRAQKHNQMVQLASEYHNEHESINKKCKGCVNHDARLSIFLCTVHVQYTNSWSFDGGF